MPIKATCTPLNLELSEVGQTDNKTVIDFYNKIQQTLNIQISYKLTHATPHKTAIIISEILHLETTRAKRTYRPPDTG